MDCPKCQSNGTSAKLRVMTVATCTCEHHPLVCEKCFVVYEVPHGDPRDPQMSLVPGVTLTEDKVFDTPADPTHGLPSGRDILKDGLASDPDAFPTVDEYRAQSQPADPMIAIMCGH